MADRSAAIIYTLAFVMLCVIVSLLFVETQMVDDAPIAPIAPATAAAPIERIKKAKPIVPKVIKTNNKAEPAPLYRPPVAIPHGEERVEPSDGQRPTRPQLNYTGDES